MNIFFWIFFKTQIFWIPLVLVWNLVSLDFWVLVGSGLKNQFFFRGKTSVDTELHQALSPTTTQNTDESNHAQNRSSPFLTHLFATRRLHLALTRRDLDRADQVGERRGDVLDRIDEQHLGVGFGFVFKVLFFWGFGFELGSELKPKPQNLWVLKISHLY